MRAIQLEVTAQKLIGTMSLFRGSKDTPLLNEIVASFKYVELHKGDFIFRDGDEPDGMYVLLGGEVRNVSNQVQIAAFHAGDSFGELDLFGAAARSSDAIAMQTSLCAFVPGAAVARLLKAVPRIATNLMRMLSIRLRTQTEMLIAAGLSAPQVGAAAAFETPLQMLQAVPMFRGIADAAFLNRVLSFTGTRHVSAGSTIFAPGDPGEQLYIVAAGRVLVHAGDLELMRLDAGQSFGEMSLLDGVPRRATATAMDDVALLTLSRPQFHAALSQAPEVGANILSGLSARIRHLNRVLAVQESGRVPASLIGERRGAAAPCDIWVKDAATGAWHLPVPVEPVADGVAALVPRGPSHPAAADFKRAVEADASAMDAALAQWHDGQEEPRRLDHGAFQRLRHLTATLFEKLRSPLFPKRVHGELAASLYQGSLAHRPVQLHAVLASPTVLSEIGSFIAFARQFEQAEIRTTLNVLLVRWENIVDVAHLDLVSRAAAFESLRTKVVDALKAAHLADWRVMPINIVAAERLRHIDAPADVLHQLRSIEAASSNPTGADAATSQNLLWITDFYARQASLQRLGPVQPLMDLAIRASIGRRVSARIGRMSIARRQGFLMLTSELHRRFLPCYGTRVPTANIALA